MICKQNCEEKISWTERFIGHFAAPSLMGAITGGLAGAYLIQFYTDVLGLAGALIVWMPAIAKVASSLTGVLLGWLIDHTRTKFGKARPWLLASGALIGICGMLLYSVPSVSIQGRMVWILISYNLFFSFVFPAYGISHGMLVPLSTRNQKQRDGLALISSIASVAPCFTETPYVAESPVSGPEPPIKRTFSSVAVSPPPPQAVNVLAIMTAAKRTLNNFFIFCTSYLKYFLLYLKRFPVL